MRDLVSNLEPSSSYVIVAARVYLSHAETVAATYSGPPSKKMQEKARHPLLLVFHLKKKHEAGWFLSMLPKAFEILDFVSVLLR